MAQTLARILIADDHTFSLRVMVRWLRDEGYFCDYIPDSQKISVVLEAKPYDVLIADQTIFSRQEVDVLRTLYHTRHHLPVLLVTHALAISAGTEERRFGVMEYLCQPLDAQALLRRVRQIMASRRGWQLSPAGDVALTHTHKGRRVQEASPEPLRNVGKDRLPHTLAQYLEQTLAHLGKTTSNLQLALASLKRDAGGQTLGLCAFLTCPHTAACEAVVRRALDVLQQTQGAVAPQDLEALRTELEALVQGPPVPSGHSQPH